MGRGMMGDYVFVHRHERSEVLGSLIAGSSPRQSGD